MKRGRRKQIEELACDVRTMKKIMSDKGNGENLGAVSREGLSNERTIRAENREVREGGDYVEIRLQEEPAEQRSQKRPGALPCPGVCEGQGTRRQRGWSGLRTGVEAGLGTELGKVRLC